MWPSTLAALCSACNRSCACMCAAWVIAAGRCPSTVAVFHCHALFFKQHDPRQPLRLEHPQVAAIFAHELLHQWQRLHGRAVTREALGLQLQAICLRRNPYHYPRAVTAEAMLACFLRSSVEQQGQMWEDYVQAAVQGEYLPCMELVASHVRGA